MCVSYVCCMRTEALCHHFYVEYHDVTTEGHLLVSTITLFRVCVVNKYTILYMLFVILYFH